MGGQGQGGDMGDRAERRERRWAIMHRNPEQQGQVF